MAEEKRVNLKAAKFQKYLDDNKLTFFRRDASNDEADTIVFQSSGGGTDTAGYNYY